MSARGPIAALREFARPRAVGPRCDLCRAPILAGHEHLLERGARALQCACGACALLFAGAAETRFLRVPPRTERLDPGALDDAILASLGVPVELAFIAAREGAVTAVYPSPAGPVESTVEPAAWESLLRALPALRSLAPEVEAALFTRFDRVREVRIVSIDRAFALVGLVRTRWRGLSGGPEAARAMRDYLRALDAGAGTHEAAEPLGDGGGA